MQRIALFLVTLFALVPEAGRISAAKSNEVSVDATAEAVKIWSTYKYGMFIHFGLATFTDSTNENAPANATLPPTTYAPAAIDADQWIRVARDAGMKYAVLTVQHSSGFCLWDSKVPWHGKEFDFDVANSGNPTDVVAAFVQACKKYGVAPGLYWSPINFHNNSMPPGKQWRAGRLPDDYFQFAKAQFSELIANYPDVAIYWIDIPRAASADQRRAIYDLIKQERPGTVVLFNHGTKPPATGLTIDQYQDVWPTDILNSERHPIRPGLFQPVQTWRGQTYTLGYEHCDCLGRYWFWQKSDRPRPVNELLAVYKQTIAAGGNMLIDVPPDRSGRISDDRVVRLKELKKAIDQK